ncbi:MAG: CNT family concentrative nucleoside transporter, partial [Salibacteraceae bacterium]
MDSMSFSLLSILQGVGGLVFLVALLWLFSTNKKAINWPLVIKGLVLQVIFAIAILKIGFIETGFEWVSRAFVKVISFTNFGSEFLFGQFGSGAIHPALGNFAFVVLPTIIFFSALTSLLYYLGVLQKVVYGMAWVMKRVLKLSGAESLAAAGNIFLGQTEAPLLVKPYLGQMTKSEMMSLMTGGMATIAGGVLAAYIGFLGGDNPIEQTLFAKHLLAASIMSAPAAIVAAKILVPETEKFDNTMHVNKEKMGANALEAISNGTTDGLKLAI